MSGIKVQAYGETPAFYFPEATGGEQYADGSLHVQAVKLSLEDKPQDLTVVATFAPGSWLMVALILDEEPRGEHGPIPIRPELPDVPNPARLGRYPGDPGPIEPHRDQLP